MGYCPYCNAYVPEGTDTCGNCGQTSQVIQRTYDQSYSYNNYPMYPPQQPQQATAFNPTLNPSNSPSYSPTYNPAPAYNPTPSASGYGSQYAAQTGPSIFSYQPYRELSTGDKLANLGIFFLSLAGFGIVFTRLILILLPFSIVGIIFGALAMATGSKPFGLIVISMGMMEFTLMMFFLLLIF